MITLCKRRRVNNWLLNTLYSSKYAPRSHLSNASRFISFGQLLNSLRAHLWTPSLKKKHTMGCMRVFFRKKTQIMITLFTRRRPSNSLLNTLYGLKDAPRSLLSNALSFVSFEQLNYWRLYALICDYIGRIFLFRLKYRETFLWALTNAGLFYSKYIQQFHDNFKS